jgi:hypothetical protein
MTPKTTFRTRGATTTNTNTPKKIMPIILKTLFASFIVYSPFTPAF